MFPGGVNPKQMGQMMKRFGIKNEELEAKRVIIELENGKKIVFEKPSVQSIEMQGSKTYTIAGSSTEEHTIPEEDIKMVAEQAGVSEKKAKEQLEKDGGDIAQAILHLKEN